MPIPLPVPGTRVAPVCSVVAPTVPLPASVAPWATVTADWASAPLTASVPAATMVAPDSVLVPVRFSRPAPVLVKRPLPLIALAKAASLAWSMTRAAWLVRAPLPKLVADPMSVPAAMVVPPV